MPFNEDVPSHAEIGECIVLVQRKRNGKYKARCVFNGRQQKKKWLYSKSSPALDPESISLGLAYAALQGWSFYTADLTTAFLNEPLPEGVEVFTEIMYAHDEREKRNTHVFRVKRSIYGVKEASAIYWSYFGYWRTTGSSKVFMMSACFTPPSALH